MTDKKPSAETRRADPELQHNFDLYAQAARVIGLYLGPWCDTSLCYADMIAEASRRVAAEVASLQAALRETEREREKGLAEIMLLDERLVDVLTKDRLKTREINLLVEEVGHLQARAEAAEAHVARLTKALDNLQAYAAAELVEWSERNADRYWEARRFKMEIDAAQAPRLAEVAREREPTKKC